MTLLKWELPFVHVAQMYAEGRADILLPKATLTLPPLPQIGTHKTICGVAIRLGGASGLEVEAQGRAHEMAVMGHILGVSVSVSPLVLTGNDADSSIWTIRDGTPRINYSPETKGATFWLSPNFTKVVSRFPWPMVDQRIELAFESNVRLPECNVSEGKKGTIRGSKTGSYIGKGVDVSHFEEGGLRIMSIQRTKGLPLLTQIERVVDALSLVNGFRAEPLLARSRERHGCALWIFKRQSNRQKGAIPPMTMDSDQGREATWRMFATFLRFILKARKEPPKISKWLSEFQAAYGPSFASTRALTTLVAIEGIVTDFVRDSLASTWSDSKANRWIKWAEDQDIELEIKRRLQNAFLNAKNPGAGKLLRALGERGVVPSELAKLWEKARPRLAHGKAGTANESNKAFLCAVDLFHCIVLSIVGYVGQFRRYTIEDSYYGEVAAAQSDVFIRGRR